MAEEGIYKTLESDVTGWTSYLALEKVLKKWHEKTGVEYVEWLYQSLRTDPALIEDWAVSLEEAIKERGEGNREWLEPVVPEKYKEHFKQKALRDAALREQYRKEREQK